MDERIDDVWIIYVPRTANMPEDSPPDFPLVEVGRYERLSQAKERALVVSAMELPHWIVREGRAFILRVEPPAQAAVAGVRDYNFTTHQMQFYDGAQWYSFNICIPLGACSAGAGRVDGF